MQKPSVSHTENYQAGMESRHGDVGKGCVAFMRFYVSRMTSSCVFISKLMLVGRVRARLNKTWRNEQSICHILVFSHFFFLILFICFVFISCHLCFFIYEAICVSYYKISTNKK